MERHVQRRCHCRHGADSPGNAVVCGRHRCRDATAAQNDKTFRHPIGYSRLSRSHANSGFRSKTMVKESGSSTSIRVPLLLLIAAIVASFIASSGPIQWMDNGQFMADASVGRYFSESLGPLDHPLYQFFNTGVFDVFGSLILSLLNSILLIPLAWIIYQIAVNVGATTRQALLAASVTILSHAVFWVSTKAEVYIFHSLFVLAAYWVYFDRTSTLGDKSKLLIIGVLTGLGAAIHQLTFVILLPLYIQLLWQYKSRTLMTLPGFALGFVVAYPAIVHDLQQGLNLIEIGRRYLTGTSAKTTDAGWEGSLFRFDDMWHEKNSVFILLLSLVGPTLLGLVLLPKDRKLRLLWCAAALNFVFAVSYDVTDRFTFFLPGLALLGILGVIRLQALLPHTRTGAALLDLSVLSCPVALLGVRSEEHTSELQSHRDLHSFPTRRSSDLHPRGYPLAGAIAAYAHRGCVAGPLRTQLPGGPAGGVFALRKRRGAPADPHRSAAVSR